MSMNYLLGTAREAYENSQYDKLVDKYGKLAAEKIIEPQLIERNLTLDEFQVYRRVKKVIQNDGLNVVNARTEAEALASETIHEVFA